MTIQQQYNTELDRILKEIKNIIFTKNDSLFIYKDQLGHKYIALDNGSDLYKDENLFSVFPKINMLRESIIEILTAKDSDGNFLFPEGQEENPSYNSRLESEYPESESEYLDKEEMFDIGVDAGYTLGINYCKPRTLSQLFIENCLLTGVDEIDLKKIENLKKVKFV